MKDIPGEKYEAFRKMFEANYKPLCNYAYTYLKDPAASEDIVQEVFLRVWEKRSDLVGTAALRYYLFTAVRNNCITHLQQQKKSASLFSEAAAVEDRVHPGTPAEEQTRDGLSLVREAVSELPPKCRDIFLLSRIGNLSYKEIAKTRGISVKTVENQIGKALKIMRDFLKRNRASILVLILACFQSAGAPFVGDWLAPLFY